MKNHLRLTTTWIDGGWSVNAHHLATALRLGIGAVFSTAGILKLANQGEFAKALENQGLFPAGSIDLLAVMVPLVEILLGICFCVGVRTILISRILVGLLAVFTLVGAIALFQGRAADCGCFPTSGEGQHIDTTFFVRNALLILSCLCVNAIHRRTVNGSLMV
jgi:uncharacterized membrane protein YphA (DoxX/SURF4 family)